MDYIDSKYNMSIIESCLEHISMSSSTSPYNSFKEDSVPNRGVIIKKKRNISEKDRNIFFNKIVRLVSDKCVSTSNHFNTQLFTSDDIILSRCKSSMEKKCVEKLLSRNIITEPITLDNKAIVNILLSPSISQLGDKILEPLYTIAERLLRIPVEKQVVSDCVNEIECSTCSKIMIPIVMNGSSVCSLCGFYINVDLNEIEYVSNDINFSSGRISLHNTDIYSKFTQIPMKSHQFKTELCEKVRSICDYFNPRASAYVNQISYMVVQYSLFSKTVKSKLIIAACVYLVLRKNYESVTISMIAAKLKLSTTLLANTVFRIAIILGLTHLPSYTISGFQDDIINRIFNTNCRNNTMMLAEKNSFKEKYISLEAVEDYSNSQFLNTHTTKSFRLDSLDQLAKSDNAPTHEYASVQPSESMTDEDTRNKQSLDNILSLLFDNNNNNCKSTSFDDILNMSSDCEESKNTSIEPKQTKKYKKKKCQYKMMNNKLKNDLMSLTNLILKVYSKATQSTKSTSNKQRIWTMLLKYEIDNVTMNDVYNLASALYYSMHYLRIGVSQKELCDIMTLNNGTFGRHKSQFIKNLRKLLETIGFLDNTFIKDYHFNTKCSTLNFRQVLDMIQTNSNLLIHYEL